MAIWDEALHEASFDGVTFPVAQRSITGGRALARRRYPNRPGQSVEDTGREPYAFEITIPLFAGISPDLYPSTFEALRGAVDHPDTTGEAEYVDPELGPLNCKVINWQWKADAGARDGGIFTLKLEEVSFDDIVFSIDRASDPQGDAEDAGRALDDGSESLGIDEADLARAFGAAGVPLSADERDYAVGTLWTTQVAQFVDTLGDGIASAEMLGARVDILRARIDALTSRPEMQAPAAVYMMHAAMQLAGAIGDLAASSIAKAPPLVEHVLTAEMSIYEVSSALYGTVERAEEILQRNPSPTPLFLPRGTRLVVLAT